MKVLRKPSFGNVFFSVGLRNLFFFFSKEPLKKVKPLSLYTVKRKKVHFTSHFNLNYIKLILKLS